MTYTIMGRCARSGQIGYAIATVSLNVGAVCPAVSRTGDLVCSQAFTNRRLQVEGVRRLDDGMAPDEVMAHLAALDPHFAYRQVGIVTRAGLALAHSGDACHDWKGHHCGQGWLAMGNVLAGAHVATAMAASFEGSESEPLAERLMKALEAGRDAGGQVDQEGRHYTERSSRLAVYGWDADGYPELSELDVRIDVHDTAIAELRRQYEIVGPLTPYQHLKAHDPSTLMSSAEWEERHLPPRPPRYD